MAVQCAARKAQVLVNATALSCLGEMSAMEWPVCTMGTAH